MKAVVICPGNRPSVAQLAERAPLVLCPVLGKNLIEYWLEFLVERGAKEITLLSDDRPERVREFVSDGARWGLAIVVQPEARELSPVEAKERYGSGAGPWLPSPWDVATADTLPGFGETRLFENYTSFFHALLNFLPRAATPERLGVRQAGPGIWVGLHARVSPAARLQSPCWIGACADIGAEAVIGPNAIVENHALVGPAAEVSNSIVAPETFVGTLTEIRNSVSCGNVLINWRDGSSVRVTDPFLLSDLGRQPAARSPTWLGRGLALAVLALTFPVGLWMLLRSMISGQPMWRRCLAEQRGDGIGGAARPIVYYEFTQCGEWWRRWPQLWNVVRGEFAWVGSRPLTAQQAEQLQTDFEKLWFAQPIGLFSLADAEGCGGEFGDEARAHASYYAVRAGWRLDGSILWRVAGRMCSGPLSPPAGSALRVPASLLIRKLEPPTDT